MKIAVLSGAGISAESGLKTFRDSNGLWEGHDVLDVATPEGFQRNPELVLEFYNQRRRQLLQVKPNIAHKALAALEAQHDVSVITQNVDDLHERAGSNRVVHLHGELLKARSSVFVEDICDWQNDINLGDFCKNGSQMRPHIVWFGEEVPMMTVAMELVSQADIIIIVGTSMQVYPAAGLIQYAASHSKIYFVDPKPSIHSSERIVVFSEKATSGIPKVVSLIKDTY
jgi:NAD-dependent deacetylase